MGSTTNLAERVLRTIAEAPGCSIEDLVFACPDLTWNQIFLEVDRLSRTGALLLTLEGRGCYTLRLPAYSGKERIYEYEPRSQEAEPGPV